MTVDLTSPVNDLLAILLAVVTAAIPIVVPALLKRLGVANNADLSQTISNAAQAGAGAAYTYALAHEGGLARLDVKNAAIAAGVQHVANTVPDALAKLGITPANVEAMVTARLGTLLAQDPSVTAGTPQKMPAPSIAPPEVQAMAQTATVPPATPATPA